MIDQGAIERATGTVKALPMYKINDIPESLRQLANRIEHGEIDAVRLVVALEPSCGKASYVAFGQEPYSYLHCVGLLEAARDEVLACVNK